MLIKVIMRETLIKTKLMVLESMLTLTAPFTKVIGSLTNSMEMVKKLGLTESLMKVSLLLD